VSFKDIFTYECTYQYLLDNSFECMYDEFKHEHGI